MELGCVGASTVVMAPVITMCVTGWYYWQGDLLRAIFWLIVTIAISRPGEHILRDLFS